jgi:SNF2 family DNA or RNA helicase
VEESVLNMMDPIKFHSYQHFLDTWVDYYYQGNTKKMAGIRNPKRFREYTADLLIRREFNEVIEDFPDINKTKLPVQLDEMSATTYDDATSSFVQWYNEHVIGGTEDKIGGIELLAQMARMRHITGLAKIPATLGFVEEFVEDTDRKLVIFVHHKDVGSLLISGLTNTDKMSNPEYYELAQTIKDEGIRVMKLTAEFSDEERFNIQEEFNLPYRVIMVASTLASGEGVDLQTCSDCIMHERQWNPQNEEQAAPGRFRRIGQTSSVINVTFPEAEDTIDEYLDNINERKGKQYHDVMNKGERKSWSEGDFAKELAAIIVTKYKAKHKDKPQTKAASITAMAQPNW